MKNEAYLEYYYIALLANKGIIMFYSHHFDSD